MAAAFRQKRTEGQIVNIIIASVFKYSDRILSQQRKENNRAMMIGNNPDFDWRVAEQRVCPSVPMIHHDFPLVSVHVQLWFKIDCSISSDFRCLICLISVSRLNSYRGRWLFLVTYRITVFSLAQVESSDTDSIESDKISSGFDGDCARSNIRILRPGIAQ